MTQGRMRIGICGGTFDPFHRGHLDPVLAARAEAGWDRVIYVVANRQPFKVEHGAASPPHRFAMTVMSTLKYDDLFVSDLELERSEVSYTVDTLEHFHREHPAAEIDWIIGDDNVESLPRWRAVDRLFELARFVVLTRGGSAKVPAALRNHAGDGRLVFVHNPAVPVSSTEIRRRLRADESIDGLVDPLVSRYIQHYRLYREAHS